jgi:diadenosine tetraphosphate (Ap4A) HIT family hydrolase
MSQPKINLNDIRNRHLAVIPKSSLACFTDVQEKAADDCTQITLRTALEILKSINLGAGCGLGNEIVIKMNELGSLIEKQ